MGRIPGSVKEVDHFLLNLLLLAEGKQSSSTDTQTKQNAQRHHNKGLGAGFRQLQNGRVGNTQYNFELLITLLFGKQIALPDGTGHQSGAVLSFGFNYPIENQLAIGGIDSQALIDSNAVRIGLELTLVQFCTGAATGSNDRIVFSFDYSRPSLALI